MARAIAVRCFCPPLRVMPFSPISVSSPWGRSSTSAPMHAQSNARSYRSRSIERPNRTFSFRLRDCTHATCATYATVPRTRGAPSKVGKPSGPAHWCISPSNAEMRADLPLPTGPTTTVREPRRRLRLTSRRNGCSVGPGTVQWKYPREMVTTTSDAESASTSVIAERFAGTTDDDERNNDASASSTSSAVARPVDLQDFRGEDADAIATSADIRREVSAAPALSVDFRTRVDVSESAYRGSSTRTGSSMVVARASGRRKYFCSRRNATMASAHRLRQRG